MSRRRKLRRAEKARRHLEPPRPPQRPSWPSERRRPSEPPAVASEPQVVVRKADFVVRLAYTRTQAAEALGISPSTMRRLLPYLDTIELPWGGKLIPVDECEHIACERRQAALARRPLEPRGRSPPFRARSSRVSALLMPPAEASGRSPPT